MRKGAAAFAEWLPVLPQTTGGSQPHCDSEDTFAGRGRKKRLRQFKAPELFGAQPVARKFGED
jgi:hypothetical protein